MSRSLRAALAAGSTGMIAGCPNVPSPPETPSDLMASVYTVRGRDLREMTRETLDLAGGIEAVVQPGETVFIKVNMMTVGMLPGNSVARGESSKPEIVMTVAEECLRAGAAKVTIGDAAQVDRFHWADAPSLDGSTNYVRETTRLNELYGGRVELMCLMGDSASWVEVPSPYTGLGSIEIGESLVEADRVISLPVFKTHMMTKVTGSLKNFLGATPAKQPGVGGVKSRLDMHFSAGGVEQSFLDVVTAVRPDFTIVDMSVCVEGNGPVNTAGLFSNGVDMRERLGDFVLIAGSDLVAVDASATRIISHDPSNVKHLKMAWNQGLGQIDEDKIEVVGPSLESLRVEWKPATFAKTIPAEVRDIPPYCCM